MAQSTPAFVDDEDGLSLNGRQAFGSRGMPTCPIIGAVKKTLPEILEQYKTDAFWDTPLSSIDPQLHRDFVIERLLQYGGMEGIRWLFETFGPDPIENVVINSRILSRMTAGFWSAYFDIPPGKIRCLSEQTLSPLK